MSSTARAVTLRGTVWFSDARASAEPPSIMPMVRPRSLSSTSPLMTQIVRLSASPSLNSVRPAANCLTVTFFASA